VKLPLTVPLPLTEVAAALLDCGIPAVTCHNSSANGGPSQAQAILGASTGRLDVIGVGGVASGVEALSVLRSGIKAIQVGSAVVKEGVGVFARLKREIANSVEFRQ
jgi:dihydroorotate dehydrogenase